MKYKTSYTERKKNMFINELQQNTQIDRKFNIFLMQSKNTISLTQVKNNRIV